MKVLWVPQISSKGSGGELLDYKDSNFVFLQNLLKGRQEAGVNNASFDIKVYSEHVMSQQAIDTLLSFGVHGECCSRKFTDAYSERFNFNLDSFAQVLGEYKPDIVFLNDPCKVLGVRQAIKLSSVEKVKVICYNHWLAVDNMPELMLRQVEGTKAADLTLCNSNYAKGRIRGTMQAYGNEFCHVEVLQPPIGCEVRQAINAPVGCYVNISYNHRVSSDPYYSKAFNLAISVCDALVAKGYEFCLYVFNPTGKRLPVTRSYIWEVGPETQEEYFLILHECHVHLNTFIDSKGMWSMATAEAAACGNACLLYDGWGYAEMLEAGYHGYYKTQEELTSKLLEYFEDPFAMSSWGPSGVSKWSAYNQVTKLKEILEGVL